MLTKKITDSITWFSSEKNQVNSTLIELTDAFVIVDTMLYPQDAKEIRKKLEERHKPVKYIINT
ncbi:MAG: hypothetical protein PHR06_02070, partial [Candidatus Cloacimonetes bacterium]|nr:hypothetical protein [Candidatus Cloacimonadota bacterium]